MAATAEQRTKGYMRNLAFDPAFRAAVLNPAGSRGAAPLPILRESPAPLTGGGEEVKRRA
ncbi:hypothetical protein [Methylobacterium sp. CCH5-D2]|uniref:hypothetical protein n=1 Tax=Methylobacterium sp. CCH5-D2 TaxID=1768765 RepID=UPI00082DD3FC|nr:hypothetical protein [Methylobacterium sp. CCH5-D2]